ncbi:DUF6270 domain-containing protein [Acinetobacter thermotolerans]|uniref:DUF6270 domain-containing protein n=1 Tax=Acinetobacter thermotolerans TaxID=3151487 RepID=UPI00325AF340
MVKVIILGSCVTRDAFESKIMQNNIKIVKYFARNSLARLAFPVFPIQENEINLKSKFQRKVLKYALSGDYMDVIKEQEFDYLLLDVVDDRFGLVKLNDEEVYVTFSDELKNSKFITNTDKIKILANSQFYRDAWEFGLKELLKVVPPNKIIINNVQWATHTNMGNALSKPERIAFCTDVVNGLYQIAAQYIPEENFINYPVGIFIGDENHKWGRSPFHYVDDVYNYFNFRFLEISASC